MPSCTHQTYLPGPGRSRGRRGRPLLTRHVGRFLIMPPAVDGVLQDTALGVHLRIVHLEPHLLRTGMVFCQVRRAELGGFWGHSRQSG